MKFTCVANDSDTVQFFVNGYPATDTTVINKRFKQSTDTLPNGLRIANLTVTASSLNNNSMIQCRAIGTSMNTNSDEVILRVQGTLNRISMQPGTK